MLEVAAYQGDSSSIITAESFEAWASAIFLEQQEANACLSPVSGEACRFGRVKDVRPQVQYFWNSKKPMPVLAQSVVRHVGLAGSKMCTPSSILVTITCLDSLNRSFRVLFHTNLVPGLSCCLKGCMCDAMLKA